MADFIGGDQPRAKHAVAVNRLAQAALLRPAHRHVEPGAVSRNVAPGIGGFDVATALANHHHQLGLVVVATVQVLQGHARTGTAQRTVGLEEQTNFLDFQNLVVVVNLGLLAGFVQMLFVVDRGRHNLAGVGHWRQPATPRQGQLGRGRCNARDLGHHRRQMRDQQIVAWQGVVAGGQHRQSSRHITHTIGLYQAELVVVESTNFHRQFLLELLCILLRGEGVIGGGMSLRKPGGWRLGKAHKRFEHFGHCPFCEGRFAAIAASRTEVLVSYCSVKSRQ